MSEWVEFSFLTQLHILHFCPHLFHSLSRSPSLSLSSLSSLSLFSLPLLPLLPLPLLPLPLLPLPLLPLLYSPFPCSPFSFFLFISSSYSPSPDVLCCPHQMFCAAITMLAKAISSLIFHDEIFCHKYFRNCSQTVQSTHSIRAWVQSMCQ